MPIIWHYDFSPSKITNLRLRAVRTGHGHTAQVVDRDGDVREGHGGRRAGALIGRATGRLHEERGGHAR